MAFLEDIGKKISQTSQGAVQKTKDFTEITKLNGQISQLQKEAEGYYNQLGKAYYELHKEDAEQALAGLTSSIKNTLQQVDQLNEQIQKIKTAKRCVNCGNELGEDTMFCPVCGTKVPEPEPQPVSQAQPAPMAQPAAQAPSRFCTNCGAAQAADAAFCSECGSPMAPVQQ